MNNLSLSAEVIQLQNRLGRFLPVPVSCFVFRKRYYVVVHASAGLPARQLGKSAEHVAHQLVCHLGIDPELVDFFQFQPGEEPEWLRWSFQWVGQSPLKGRCLDVTDNFRQAYLEPLLRDGVPFALAGGAVPALEVA